MTATLPLLLMMIIDSVVGNVLENTDMDISACSASSQKVQEIEGASTPKEKGKISGYRMIAASILNNIFKLVLCPRCSSESSLSLSDIISKKHGLSSLLRLSCTNCDYNHEFHTSAPCNRGHDVNRRIIYTCVH